VEDRSQYGVDFLIPPWIPPAANDPQPLKALSTIVKAYEPGQGNVDGGGFSVIKETEPQEGYIDDVEFALADNSSKPKGSILVRSASRVGYTDLESTPSGSTIWRRNSGTIRVGRFTRLQRNPTETIGLLPNEARAATFDADCRSLRFFCVTTWHRTTG
jgi:hypothetical protein